MRTVATIRTVANCLLAIYSAIFVFPAAAQQPAMIAWIGYLAESGSSPNQAFLQGLRDLGYVESKNIGFVFRTTDGNTQRRAELAAELVRLKVDIIIADAAKRGWDVDPHTGAELETLAKEVINQPKEVIERMKWVLGN